MKAKITTRLVDSLKPSEKAYEVRDTANKGFLARVQPTGHIGFYVEFRNESGRKRRVSLGGADEVKVAVARDAAIKHISDARLGSDPAEERQEKRKVPVTLRELLDGPHEEHLRNRGCRSTAIIIRTMKTNFAEWLDEPINTITSWRVDKWRLARADDAPLTRIGAGSVPRKVGAAAINRPIQYLKSALNVAVAAGLLPVNPLSGLRLKRELETATRFLDDGELARLMAVLTARDGKKHDRLLPFVSVALNTGIRQNEIETLDWSDVDLGRGILTVRPINAKSGKMRHIPINDTLRPVLEAWRDRTCGEGPVFEMGYPRRAWRALMKTANIIEFRFHDCRHTFASRLVMSGADLFSVQRLLGHATPAMTARYAHLSPDHMAAIVAKLDKPANVVKLDATQTA